MNMNRKKIADCILKILLFLWLASLIIGLVFFLHRYFYLELDDDNGSEMILSKILAERGGILRKDWYYSTELRVINTQLIYSVLFRVCSDWHIVRLAGNAIMYLILLAAVWYLCRELHIRKYFCVIAAMYMIPMSYDYYFFALHSAYLLPHITLSMLLLAMYLHYCQAKKKRIKMFLTILLGILSFLVGLGGIRHIIVFYLPLVCSGLFMVYLNRKEIFEKRIFENHYVRECILAAAISVAAIFGFLINHLILKKIFDFNNYGISQNSYFCPFNSENIEQVVNGWLRVYGYQDSGSLFSLQLIRNVLPAAIVLFCFYSINKKNEKFYDDQQKILFAFWGSGVFSLSVLYIFSTMPYEDRYIMLISVFAFPLIFATFDNLKITDRLKNILILLFCLLLTICAVINYKSYASIDDSWETRRVTDILLEKGYMNGFSFLWWDYGNCVTEYSNGQIEVWKKTYDVYDVETEFSVETLHTNRRWLEDKNHSIEMPTGKIFVIIDNPIDKLNEGEILYYSDTVIVYGYASYDELVNDAEK